MFAPVGRPGLAGLAALGLDNPVRDAGEEKFGASADAQGVAGQGLETGFE